MGIESPSVGQILKCRLVRDERVGFGFSVKGGVDFGSPINIFKIAPGGPADRSQMVKVTSQSLLNVIKIRFNKR